MKIISAAVSDIGNTRAVNQDSVFLKYKISKKGYMVLMSVCDGIGGLQCGEVASGFIVNEMDKWWDNITSWVNIDTAEADVIFSHLKDAAEEWNADLYEYKVNNGLQTGTTMSVFFAVNGTYYTLQVGDSRVYLARDGQLMQLTMDATVNRLKNGVMKPYLNNYMSKSESLYATYSYGDIRSDDVFFCCSDGFYHNLLPTDIIVKKSAYDNDKKMNKLCVALKDAMIERGDKDNISVTMIYFK